MDIETIRSICLSLPSATEGVKWGNDLCFMVGEKMFCVTSLNAPLSVSFKVNDGEFNEMINLPGIKPAPYVARYKWILVEDPKIFRLKEWEEYITRSYTLVRNKLPKKKLEQLKSV